MDKKTKAVILPKQEKEAGDFISLAIENKVPVETMERLLAMRRELKQEKAKEAFMLAMAKLQKELPEIKVSKDIYTKSGEKAYSYAPLDTIVRQVKNVIADNGFSYSIQTETKEKMVKATCIVRHIMGHEELSSMEVPLGNKTPIMSDTQVTAAAITFAKRYAFNNAFGIMTADKDDENKLTEEKADVSPYLDKLEKCLDRKTLTKVWGAFPKEVKANREVIAKAKEINSFIQNESILTNK